jgi:hypothetical protein
MLGPFPASCGDGVCDSSDESCLSCPADCGSCTSLSYKYMAFILIRGIVFLQARLTVFESIAIHAAQFSAQTRPLASFQ